MGVAQRSHRLHPTVAIVGPTASGKTALSIAVARQIPAEIISMDSRQLYRGQDIATAKPSAQEKAGIPHHGLDLVSPGERFSAGQFADRARKWIEEIRERKHLPLLVGGSGFFLRALTHPIFREPALDDDRRQRLRVALDQLPDETLHRWLTELDPPTAERLRSWGGRQRLLRALELPLLTGQPLSWWHRNAQPDAPPLDPLVFVLAVPREELDRRIAERVDRMVHGGLLTEVRRLMDEGHDETSPGLRAHGYQEVVPYLRGEKSLETALDDVVRATRAYARRQLTWFRNQLPESAVWLDGSLPVEHHATQIVQAIRNHMRASYYREHG